MIITDATPTSVIFFYKFGTSIIISVIIANIIIGSILIWIFIRMIKNGEIFQ